MEPIIITGFHRTGSSMVCKLFADNGLNYAIYPMLGNISNPDGHFEDNTLCLIHNNWLARCKTNWQFHDEVNLNLDHGYRDQQLNHYILKRQHEGDWLVKDPRISLFLDTWYRNLNGKGKFILLFRHWKLCVQSLLKRESRYIAYHQGGYLKEPLRFWTHPMLALEMWLAYNIRILQFYEAHNKNCILINTNYIHETDLISLLNKRCQLKLTSNFSDFFKPTFYNVEVDSLYLSVASQSIRSRCNALYQALCQLQSNNKNNHSEVNEYNKTNNLEKYEKIRLTLNASVNNYQIHKASLLNKNKRNSIEKILNLSYKYLPLQDQNMLAVIDRDLSHYSNHPIALEHRARIAEMLGDFEAAEDLLKKSIYLQPRALSYMLIAQMKEKKCLLGEALYYYKLAKDIEPSNPEYWYYIANILLYDGRLSEAFSNLKKGLLFTRKEPLLYTKLSDLYLSIGSTKNASLILEQGPQCSHLIQSKKVDLLIKHDLKKAQEDSKALLINSLKEVNHMNHFTSILSFISDEAAFNQCLQCLIKHYSSLFDDNLINKFSAPAECV